MKRRFQLCAGRAARGIGPGAFARANPVRGFTLIELLVAAGITALLAAYMVVVTANASAFWSRTTGRINGEARALAVLDLVSRDLSSALSRDDGQVWFAASIPSAPAGASAGLWQHAGANPKPISESWRGTVSSPFDRARFGSQGVWLRLFTQGRGTSLDPRSSVGPVAVGYQVVRRSLGADVARSAYLLHRAEVRPAAIDAGNSARPGTLESGFDLRAAPYSASAYVTPGDPGGIHTPGREGDYSAVIADHVVDFGLRCHVYDPDEFDGLRTIFPVLESTPSASFPTAELSRLPDVVDVAVRVLTETGAQELAAFEQGAGPALSSSASGEWWRLVLAHSHVFTRRILVRPPS